MSQTLPKGQEDRAIPAPDRPKPNGPEDVANAIERLMEYIMSPSMAFERSGKLSASDLLMVCHAAMMHLELSGHWPKRLTREAD